MSETVTVFELVIGLAVVEGLVLLALVLRAFVRARHRRGLRTFGSGHRHVWGERPHSVEQTAGLRVGVFLCDHCTDRLRRQLVAGEGD